MNLLIRLQTIQDLLSEKTGLSLALYNHKLQEVTIPSGLPQSCLQMTTCNNECLRLLHQTKTRPQQQPLVTICCHNRLHTFAYQTGIAQAKQRLILLGGRIADPDPITEYQDLITAIYGIPLEIPSKKDRSAFPQQILRAQSRYGLTRQEINILFLIGKGFTNQDIASKLYISTNTVKTHVSNILRKLKVENRTEAALLAFDKGLIQGDESS